MKEMRWSHSMPLTIPVGSKCCWYHKGWKSSNRNIQPLRLKTCLKCFNSITSQRVHTMTIAARSASFTCISNNLFFLKSHIHMKSKPKITWLYFFPTTLVQDHTESLKAWLWLLRHTTKQTCKKLCPVKDVNPRLVNRSVTNNFALTRWRLTM